MKCWISILAVSALTLVACAEDHPTALESGALAAAGPEGSGRPFETNLSGAAEVPGPGDPDGSGTARLRLNAGQRMVCWQVTWMDIEDPTAAHIHRGPAGVAGPVVVPLSPIAGGCASGVDRGLIREILVDPAAFYVNVHNEEFPAGAIRGQLSR